MDYGIRLKVKEAMQKKGWNAKELSARSGVNYDAIMHMLHNDFVSIRKDHLEKVAETLEMKEITELIDFKVPLEKKRHIKWY